MTIEDIIENFAFLDEWEDRYRYLIELGRTLEPLPETARTDANKVLGCASQVWLETTTEPAGSGEPIVRFKGDSDAHIVRGLIALVFALYSGRTPAEIIATDAQPLFKDLGLSAHLTPQRSNGVRSMVQRIKHEAHRAAEAHVA
jgi:cysteine desulfuration protein SufE